MELLRKILIEIEKQPPSMRAHLIQIPGHSPEETYEHAWLAQSDGLIEAKFHPSVPTFVVRRLTSDGQDFLAAAKQETLWAEANDTIRKSIGTVTVAALRTVLSEVVQKALAGRF